MSWNLFFNSEEIALIKKHKMLSRCDMMMSYPDRESVIKDIKINFGYSLANDIAGRDDRQHDKVFTYIQQAKWEEIKRIAEMEHVGMYLYMQGV